MNIDYLKNHQEYIVAVSQWDFDMWSYYNPDATRKNQIEKYKLHCNIDILPLTLIALNENYEVIGMCSLRETDGIRSDLTPWVGSLYVLPSYRGQKVGEKLINAIKRIAKGMDFDTLYLLTFDEHVTEYYTSLGWSLIGQDNFNNHPVSVMEIKLP